MEARAARPRVARDAGDDEQPAADGDALPQCGGFASMGSGPPPCRDVRAGNASGRSSIGRCGCSARLRMSAGRRCTGVALRSRCDGLVGCCARARERMESRLGHTARARRGGASCAVVCRHCSERNASFSSRRRRGRRRNPGHRRLAPPAGAGGPADDGRAGDTAPAFEPRGIGDPSHAAPPERLGRRDRHGKP